MKRNPIKSVDKSNQKCPSIDVNDVFEELIDRNRELEKQIKLFFEFKLFFERICVKLNSHLNENDLNDLKTFHNQFKDVFGDKSSQLDAIKREERDEEIDNMVSLEPIPDNQSVSDFVYKCPEKGCNKSYGNKYKLNSHRKGHSLKPFKCDKCEATFKTRSKLKSHSVRTHPGNTLFKCTADGCSRAYKIKYSLDLHFKRTHKQMERTFVCDFEGCPQKCFTNYELKKHKVCHSKDRPFVCRFDGCDKTYKVIKDLRYHNLKCHTEWGRPFKCTQPNCGKDFIDSDSLRRHRAINHEKHKYVCDWPGCEYTTGCKQLFKRHEKLHRPEREFSCSWPECGKTFKHKANLRDHMAIHLNDKRFVCSWPGCQYRCFQRSNLKTHERFHKLKLVTKS